MQQPKYERSKRTWVAKFSDSFRGVAQVVRVQNSFHVHIVCAIFSCGAALFFQFDSIRWAVLILTIALVLSMEIVNTAIEALAREVTDKFSPHVRQSLDMASAAVLVVAFGAVVVGVFLFWLPVINYLFGTN